MLSSRPARSARVSGAASPRSIEVPSPTRMEARSRLDLSTLGSTALTPVHSPASKFFENSRTPVSQVAAQIASTASPRVVEVPPKMKVEARPESDTTLPAPSAPRPAGSPDLIFTGVPPLPSREGLLRSFVPPQADTMDSVSLVRSRTPPGRVSRVPSPSATVTDFSSIAMKISNLLNVPALARSAQTPPQHAEGVLSSATTSPTPAPSGRGVLSPRDATPLAPAAESLKGVPRLIYPAARVSTAASPSRGGAPSWTMGKLQTRPPMFNAVDEFPRMPALVGEPSSSTSSVHTLIELEVGMAACPEAATDRQPIVPPTEHKSQLPIIAFAAPKAASPKAGALSAGVPTPAPKGSAPSLSANYCLSDQSSAHLQPGMGVCPTSLSVEEWCKMMGLGENVPQRLREEQFSSPVHVAYLDKRELHCLASGLRLGEKGKFYHAVHVLRATLGLDHIGDSLSLMVVDGTVARASPDRAAREADYNEAVAPQAETRTEAGPDVVTSQASAAVTSSLQSWKCISSAEINGHCV